MFPLPEIPAPLGRYARRGRRHPAAKLTLKKLQMKRQALQKLNR